MEYTQQNNLHKGSRSPWGKVDFIDHIAIGIDFVTTPGHGGVKLSAQRNRQVDSAWRTQGGWYEEDCEWAIAAFTFPNDFPDRFTVGAEGTAMRWFPDEYEIVTGKMLVPGQSYIRDQQIFSRNHANDLIGISAIGIGDRKVKVTVCQGGRSNMSSPHRTFIVPSVDYDARSQFGFVLDPARYSEVL